MSEKRYGRAAVMSVFLPYVYACSIYRGYIWKGISLYAIIKLMDAIYDAGIYARFFIHGPSSMRKVAVLSQEESFAAIQTHLFMKHCAMIELKKARGDLPKKEFTQLVIIKSFRNQIFDTIQSWKNFGIFLSNAGKRNPPRSRE